MTRKRNGRSGGHRTAAQIESLHAKYTQGRTTGVSVASSMDAKWFAEHPRRSHRLRETVPGEFPSQNMPAGFRMVTAVRQLMPGYRMRVGFGLVEGLPLEHVPEAECAGFFEVVYQGTLRGTAGKFGLEEVRAQTPVEA